MDSENNHFLNCLEQEWNCPIGKMPMNDPVITSDGVSYEREAISKWLQNNNKSPGTGLPLQNKTLITNIAFRNLTQKLYAELPAFLEKEESYKTEIEQLKEEIFYLRDELKHEKQKNDEFTEKEEKEFKTKKIEKLRHDHKSEQLNVIREQKNRYQKQIQELRSIEQQQSRQILSLKEQLREMTKRFQKASGLHKKYLDLWTKVYDNREQVFEKLQFAFVTNLTFTNQLLHSIERAKRYEDEKEQVRASQETIVVEGNGENNHLYLNTYNKGVITKLQEIIRETVNEGEKHRDVNDFQYREIRRFYRARQMRRQRLRRSTNDFVGDEDIYAGLQIMHSGRFVNFQELQMFQDGQRNDQINNPQVQPVPMIEENNLQIPENNGEEDAQNIQDSEFYKQHQSIKWLMSRRPYPEIPDFYNYQICQSHTKPSTYWFGIRISVLESKIPFVEFLPYSWNHVRWLDLSACNVDDVLWRKFIEKADNFKHLMYLNVRRNKIENIKKDEIEKFTHLVTFEIRRNNLSDDGLREIRQYKIQHPQIKVHFNDPLIEENERQHHLEEFYDQ